MQLTTQTAGGQALGALSFGGWRHLAAHEAGARSHKVWSRKRVDPAYRGSCLSNQTLPYPQTTPPSPFSPHLQSLNEERETAQRLYNFVSKSDVNKHMLLEAKGLMTLLQWAIHEDLQVQQSAVDALAELVQAPFARVRQEEGEEGG